MEDYWVIIIAVFSAIILLGVLLLALFLYIHFAKKKQKDRVLKPQPSQIHPKIPNPIYTISNSNSNNNVEKESKPSDTLTARKLSMMLDPKKRLSSYNQRQSYFDFANSPQPRHKEYLDFNDIDSILPKQSPDSTPPRNIGRISIIEERPFSGSTLIPVREVYSENEVSYHRERFT